MKKFLTLTLTAAALAAFAAEALKTDFTKPDGDSKKWTKIIWEGYQPAPEIRFGSTPKKKPGISPKWRDNPASPWPTIRRNSKPKPVMSSRSNSRSRAPVNSLPDFRPSPRITGSAWMHTRFPPSLRNGRNIRWTWSWSRSEQNRTPTSSSGISPRK